MLEMIKGETLKRRKNRRQNDQKEWINMHKQRGFIMTIDFKFTWMLSYMLIMRQ